MMTSGVRIRHLGWMVMIGFALAILVRAAWKLVRAER